MENTRKLQFAAELLEEVEEDTDDDRVTNEIRAFRSTIDELRHRCLQERMSRQSDQFESIESE